MRRHLALPFLVLVLAVTAVFSPAAEARRPNVLLILADDLGYGELSCQGNPQIPTPNIDSLAKGGVRFTSGYVSGPYCSPTRAGLMTGRYQQRYGHEFNPGPAEVASTVFGLSLKETTLGDRLKAAGYATGWFGKSHLGYAPQFHPLRRGFDEYFGFLGGAHDYFDAVSDANNPILRGTSRVLSMDYATEAFAREAVQFIETHKAGPWFVYLPFNAVHAPLQALDKHLARFAAIQDQRRRTFAGMLSAMDDAVGAVLAKIRECGQERDTLIFFISDNGGPTPSTTSGNGPLRGFKAQTWEGGIRVPWIVQWQGRIPAGKTDDRPVIQLDVLPTALSAAGVDIKPEWHLDGVNLLPFITSAKSGLPHESLYWRFGGQIAIRKGDWKLVKAPGGALGANALSVAANTEGAELYNLSTDIGEKANLAAREPAKFAELAAGWNAWNKELVEPAWRPAGAGGGRAAARRGMPEASNASADGPWKAGDTLSPADAPRIAGRALALLAQIEPEADSGVIVAQGGAANGYSLYLSQGRLAFAVRSARKLTSIISTEPVGKGRSIVEARLEADGRMTLSVNGRQVAEGRSPGPIVAQPARGFTVGSDDGNVGEYSGPNQFKGKIGNVTLRFP